jgi:hypothetical protein
VLSLISGRVGATMVPCREFSIFVGNVEKLWNRDDGLHHDV